MAGRFLTLGSAVRLADNVNTVYPHLLARAVSSSYREGAWHVVVSRRDGFGAPVAIVLWLNAASLAAFIQGGFLR